MSKLKIKSIAAVILSVVFLSVVFGNYYYRLRDCCEMTFLSNAVVGCTLMTCGIYSLVTNRDVKSFVYLDCAVLMSSVIMMCAIFAPRVCFSGSASLLHIMTPVLSVAFYLVFCDSRDCKKSSVFTSLVFPTAYYIFMVVFGRLRGRSVYNYFDSNSYGIFTLVLAGLAALAALVAIGYTLTLVNKIIREAGERRRGRVKRIADGETELKIK